MKKRHENGIKRIYLNCSDQFDHINYKEKLFSGLKWKDYSLKELGEFVHLLCKRAHGNTQVKPDQAIKDLDDAKLYVTIMSIIIENLKDVAERRLEDIEDITGANEALREAEKEGFVTCDDMLKEIERRDKENGDFDTHT